MKSPHLGNLMIVKQEFKNRPAILIATGPSLTEEVVETIRKYKTNHVVFGCNDAYRRVDFLDIHYACDTKWWKIHAETIKEKCPNLRSITQSTEARDEYGLEWIQGKYNPQLSTRPDTIHYGSNSGYQMLNLAFLFGCNKFILVGYNMKRVDQKAHFFGDHPIEIRSHSPYPTFVAAFNTIQKELRTCIVNCTPNSALTMFRFNKLEDELQCE